MNACYTIYRFLIVNLIRVSVVLCCAAFPVCPLGAETDSLGTIQVKEESKSLREATHDTVVYSTVLHADDFSHRKTDLAEILSETTGIHIKRYGGLDQFATASLRGSSAEQVQVYLDDVLLNPASGGGVNLATIPLDNIESIEIYRGNAPARFGTNSIGGIIQIHTKEAQKKRTTQFSSSYGSFNTAEGSITHSQKIQSLSYLASYGFSHSDGDFTYLNDNGTRFTTSDDIIQKRNNNDYNKHFLTTKLGYDFQLPLGLKWTNHFFREDRGIPGLGNLLSDTANLSTTRNVTEFNLHWNPDLSIPVQWSLNPFMTYQKNQFSDALGEVGLGQQDNDDETLSYGTEWLTHLLLGRHQKWTFLLRYQGEQFKPENFLATPTTGQASTRNQIALSIEDELYFLEEKLIINPSFRFESIFNELSSNDPSITSLSSAETSNHYPVSGKIGAKYQIIKPLSLKGSFGHYYRIPDFFELFGDRGTIIGNPGLSPEKSYNVDIGLSLQQNKWNSEIAYFFNHVTDLIQFVQTSQFTIRAGNTNKAQIQGVEWGATYRPLSFLKLSTNYTFQWAKDRGNNPSTNNRFLTGRPQHEWNLNGIATHRWVSIFSNFNLIAKNFLDSQNILEATHRALLGAGFSVNPWSPLVATFEVKNLLSDRIADIYGFPLPGRSYFGKLSLNI